MKKLILLLLLTTAFCFSQKKYCKKIIKETDKFSKEITYRSPSLEVINFSKAKYKDSIFTFMSIRFPGSTSTTGNGVKILLDNDDIIDIDVSTDVTVNRNAQYEHSAFIVLTRKQIDLLKNHLITNIRLYIHDIKIRKPEKYLNYLKCIDEKTL